MGVSADDARREIAPLPAPFQLAPVLAGCGQKSEDVVDLANPVSPDWSSRHAHFAPDLSTRMELNVWVGWRYSRAYGFFAKVGECAGGKSATPCGLNRCGG